MTQASPLQWPADGLVPAVIQDASSGDVLMVAFMNTDALEATRSTGYVHFWSRSRGRLWKKGETSGHTQAVHDIRVNCDLNSLLIEVHQSGAVCHDGYPTCYYRRLEPDNSLATIRTRWFDPEDVYGQEEGLTAILKRWWGAYEFLKEHDLEAHSGTARMIRNPVTSVVDRVSDELRELAGVLDGSHVHASPREDVILEGSQVCYWVAVESIRRSWRFEDVSPDRAMRDIGQSDVPSATSLASLLHEAANRITPEAFSGEQAHEVFTLVASSCVALGVQPRALIDADLAALRQRDYLAPYFSR